jgi:hypothetical protein
MTEHMQLELKMSILLSCQFTCYTIRYISHCYIKSHNYMILVIQSTLQDDQFIKKDNEKLEPRQVSVNEVT